MTQFNITQGKGFQMTFENGFTISVQWGYGNYSSNRNYDHSYGEERKHECFSATTAEIAVWHKDGDRDFLQIEGNCWGHVIGWLTTDEVATWITKVANAKTKEDIEVPCTGCSSCKEDE